MIVWEGKLEFKKIQDLIICITKGGHQGLYLFVCLYSCLENTLMCPYLCKQKVSEKYKKYAKPPFFLKTHIDAKNP